MNANILYVNIADDATITASSAIASAPADTVQDPHVLRRWRGRLGDTEYLLADLGSSQSFDTIALLGLAYLDADSVEQIFDSSGTTRIRVSSVDGTGDAGDVYDSGVLSGQVSSSYGQLIKLFTASPISGRYVKIDLTRASATALMAGRLVIGMRESFLYNFSYGWTFGYSDLSRRRKSAGGQTFVERDDRYRVLTLNFDFVDQDDRYGFVHEIDRINGISRDVLFVLNPESSTLDRDSIWGLIQDMSPPSDRIATSVAGIDLFSKSYNIEERR